MHVSDTAYKLDCLTIQCHVKEDSVMSDAASIINIRLKIDLIYMFVQSNSTQECYHNICILLFYNTHVQGFK